ncbi:SNF2-related protein [Clostridium paraputrificum]|uniref:Helicase n=2 Tax=Clostridium TaxID=1485 RepID=A0A1B8RSI9_9CLOT|nr:MULTISPECIES: SNF2-related protein [Clostridium]MDB2089540.1 SNF2-related protein [Clostridium paraputrificum]MDB2096476.1 SNF2-related protein [Clostridium paraputrificum]MDU1179854.1 SNF2-related protein [Clostridium sp.]MDU1228075.1 SNF2-related protein [Clostridium sp.]MDU4319662.1 SNF2-related protein [Clostridium sp.]
MNIKVVRDNVMKFSSSFSREGATSILKAKGVKDLKGKKIENIYHIYGKINSENKDYNTHIKVDMKTNKVLDTKCSCDTFIENRRHIRNYVCKHIIATNLAFYLVGKSKASNINKRSEEVVNKRKLKLHISIKCSMLNEINTYKCEFRIGESTTNLITSLKDFLEKDTIIFNDLFTYHSGRDFFSEEDTKIIEFLKSHKEKISDRFLNLKGKDLREFLSLLNERKISFNYDFITYESKVKKENVPLSLTIRADKDSFILRSQKKFPILLSNTGDVMFYDRDIYLPRKKAMETYLPYHKLFIKNNEIKYEKNLKALNNLLSDLKSITKNVVLDDGTRGFLRDISKPTFRIYKVGKEIYCNVKIDYCGYIIDLIKDKNDKSFLRDFKKENLIDIKLEKVGFIKRERDYFYIGNGEFDLLTTGVKLLRPIGKVQFSKEFEDIQILDSSFINSSIVEFDNFYRLNYEVGDFTVEELSSAIAFMKKGERFFESKDRYLDLEDPGVCEFLNLIGELSEDKLSLEIDIDKNKSLYLQEKLRVLDFIKGGDVLQKIVQKLVNNDFKRSVTPKSFNGILRKYQKEGFKWLNELSELGFGGILADDMGLGKTIQVITFVLSKRSKKTLIITPTSVLYNWKDEFERFAPNVRVGLVHGTKAQRDRTLSEIKKYDVLITTYGTLKNDENEYEKLQFDYCIIDEGQNIKNPTSKTTLSVKKINSKCNFALTGTPIENNLMELWSIFDFVMPGFLFTKERFKGKFIQNKNTEELKSLITPFILRRVKEDVLDELPEKIEKKYLVDMTTKQKSIYKSYVKEIKEKLKSSKGNTNMLTFITKLREVCLDPSLIMDDYNGGSGKINALMELLDNYIAGNKKILVFSQFTSALKNIEKNLEEVGINYIYLDGSIGSKERGELVKKFNEDPLISVFLISLKAGGVGLNLTSASVVIHFDPWWNPAIENQATDRAHRFGQKNVVEVIKLISKDTIEEKILLLQEDKKELIESLMDEKEMDGKKFKRLSEDEILNLLG